MDDRAALYAAILAHPDEDTPRLVFADWLEENGEEKYAAFIRKQIELAKVPKWDAASVGAWYGDRDALTGRGHELFQPKLPDGLKYPPLTSFRRGFPWHVETYGVGPFLTHAAWLVTQFPLQALTVRPEEGRWREPMDLSELLASPHLARLKQLNFTLARLTPETVRQLQGCPHLASVTQMAFAFAGLNVLGQAELFRPPLIDRLESLRFESCSIEWGDLAASVIAARGPHRLKRFVVTEDSPRYFRPSPVFESSLLHGLEEFEITCYDMGEEGYRALCESPVVSGLESLTLNRTHPGVHGIKALAGCAALLSLKRLRLLSNRIGPVAAKNLARSPHLPALQVLDLQGNPLGDKGALALAEAPWLANLIELDLSSCDIGNAGANALMDAIPADRMIHLGMSSVKRQLLSDDTRKKLRDKFGSRAWA